MGYFICQHCGAHLHENELDDLYEWNDKKSMGWSYTCPKCGEENYKEKSHTSITEDEYVRILKKTPTYNVSLAITNLEKRT